MKDVKGNSALHWAAYMGSENAVQFLLADKNIIIEDKEETGKTPLLIAVINSDKNENLNIVKSLLLEGADR